MKILISIVMILLLFIPISFSDSDTYTHAGVEDFVRGNGLFNDALDPDDTIVTTVVLTNPKKIPLIDDLDNDGVTEIVVIDGRNIIIYHDKELNINSSLTLNASTSERFSNMLLFDIDGDSFKEIILVGEKRGVVHILEYNASFNSSLTVQNQMDMTSFGLTHTGGDSTNAGLITIGCDVANRCLIAYANEQDSGFGGSSDNTILYVAYMNSTFLGHQLLLDTSTSLSVHCPPKIRMMAVKNYDPHRDSNVEFIFTYSEPDRTSGGSGEEVTTYWINILTNQSPVEDISSVTTTIVDELFIWSGGTDELTCDNIIGDNEWRVGGVGDALPEKVFTAPLVYDAHPTEDGMETIIGVMTDTDNFVMIMYDASGNELREYPLIEESEGQILSNVFRAEAFDDSNTEQDFCVLSQEYDNDMIMITCGSQQDTNGVGLFNTQSIEFKLDNAGLHNVTDDFDKWGIIAHSGEHDATNSNSEIITSWGVFELGFGGISCTFAIDAVTCPLELLYDIPRNDGAVIPVDFDGVNLDDFLMLRNNNLHYIEDGFTNQPAFISLWEIDPCINTAWKLNTSALVSITVTDPEDDLISARAIIYDGDVNEQDSNWSVFTSSGTEIPFPFSANKTIGAGTITMMARDIENNLTIDTIQKPFSVAPVGVEFGDCKTTGTPVPPDEVVGVIVCSFDSECSTGSVCVNSTCTVMEETLPVIAMKEASGIFNLGIGVLWLMFMMGLALAIWFTPVSKRESFMDGANARLGTIIVGEVFMLILGTIFGFLNIAILITIIILGLISISVWVTRFFVKTTA